ncbi:MAG: MotA/TolQ/ExbB proton channel family protein [SAR324 cluster bacterium]|nr:MotA/TolQ/ExbB proton channel family protein [SAR324 cluster bacterium]
MSDGLFGFFDDLVSKGGPLMYPLLLISFLGVAIVVERLLHQYRVRERPGDVFNRVSAMIRQGQAGEALDFCQVSRGALARTLGAGLTQFHKERWRLEEILAVAGQEQLAHLERFLRPLEVMAAIAPLLGLLGTVTGMMQAFRRVAEVEGTVSPSLLAGGIWEALLTTATGLTVAIPLLIFLHVFDRKREKTAVELEKFGSLFVHLRDDMLASGKGPELTRRAG